MRKSLKRILSSTAVVGLVSASLIAMASPAQASAADCRTYLSSLGYSVGEGVIHACQWGTNNNSTYQGLCRAELIVLGVSSSHASNACYLGTK